MYGIPLAFSLILCITPRLGPCIFFSSPCLTVLPLMPTMFACTLLPQRHLQPCSHFPSTRAVRGCIYQRLYWNHAEDQPRSTHRVFSIPSAFATSQLLHIPKGISLQPTKPVPYLSPHLGWGWHLDHSCSLSRLTC